MKERHITKLQKRLDDVLMQAQTAWWEWDIARNLVTGNDLKVTMLGYAPEEFRDAGYEAYTDLLHPDDYERTMQAMRDHLEGRAAIYQVDYRIRKKDGRYTWFMDRGMILDRSPEGKPLRLRGLVIDLGESIHEKAHDRQFAETLRDALPSLNDETYVAMVCIACMRLKIGDTGWHDISSALHEEFPGEVSHAICPRCLKLLYPGYAE